MKFLKVCGVWYPLQVTLQILYHMVKDMGYGGTQREFKSSGQYSQEWCPGHRFELVEYYAGRKQLRRTVRQTIVYCFFNLYCIKCILIIVNCLDFQTINKL